MKINVDGKVPALVPECDYGNNNNPINSGEILPSLQCVMLHEQATLRR